jgi:cell division ATPase FtsA
MKQSEMIVTVDVGTIRVTAQVGSVQIAFNDTENVVSKIEIETGQEYVFDLNSRTGEIVE